MGCVSHRGIVKHLDQLTDTRTVNISSVKRFLIQNNYQNVCSRSDQLWLGNQVPGILPGTGQPENHLQLLPLPWHLLLLLPGHPGEGGPCYHQHKEEAKPLYQEKELEEEGDVPGEDEATFSCTKRMPGSDLQM